MAASVDVSEFWSWPVWTGVVVKPDELPWCGSSGDVWEFWYCMDYGGFVGPNELPWCGGSCGCLGVLELTGVDYGGFVGPVEGGWAGCGTFAGQSAWKKWKKILRYNSLPPNQNILAGVRWGKSPSINGTYYLGERQVFKHNELSCFSTRAQEQSKSWYLISILCKLV